MNKWFLLGVSSLCVLGVSAVCSSAEPLPNTKPLTETGDLARKMVDGIHTYLDRELAAALKLPPRGDKFFDLRLDAQAIEAIDRTAVREQLRKSLGVVDQRVPVAEIEYVSTTGSPALVAETEAYKVFAVRWAVLPGVDGEGLLIDPKSPPRACVVALPDADWTPEMLVGLAEGVPAENQFARWLAECGCRVLVPTLIDRRDTWSANAKLGKATNQSHREFVHRMAYEMGRTLLGYEVQKTLAAVDWFRKANADLPTLVYGYGEGGMVALFTGLIEQRVKVTVVSGYHWPLANSWEEPIDRNVWASHHILGQIIRTMGPPGLVLLTAPNRLLIEWADWPAVSGPPPVRQGRSGAAPGFLKTPDVLKGEASGDVFLIGDAGRAGVTAAVNLPKSGTAVDVDWQVVRAKTGPGAVATNDTFRVFLGTDLKLLKDRRAAKPPTDLRKSFDPAARQKRQFDQLVAYTQKLWRDSEAVRKDFWKKADTKSLDAYEKSTEWYRDYFHTEVIGKLPEPTVPLNPRTRQLYDEPKWTGHEVVLDVYPDVFAYGILLLPKDLKPGEKRPVVVCQHGLEGRPTDVTNPKEKTKYYNSFGAQLADRGYIVYAPQNPYIGQTHFRQIQRKAQPLKASLFSFIVRQHQRTLDWLETLANVDAKKIGFYGLSYGGKTAMRVPAIEKRYCLSICSADFNEWVGKCVSVDLDRSYMWTVEYDMYEFDLGHTFNYAEMAYLIAPRPFMVERGHDDGVGIDEMVAYEYAKIRYLYANRLKIADRTDIEFSVGGHEIFLKGTLAFLEKHLGKPK